MFDTPMPRSRRTIPVLSVVVLLRDLKERGLVRGQIGTLVEEVDEETALVEFSDDKGRALDVVACKLVELSALKIA